tara:strand:- start:327 stop:467 length:141 start_codon:yes stop_codon:yes gene_type:complete
MKTTFEGPKVNNVRAETSLLGYHVVVIYIYVNKIRKKDGENENNDL